jgi:membrane protein DedA with SNARE-associated domain
MAPERDRSFYAAAIALCLLLLSVVSVASSHSEDSTLALKRYETAAVRRFQRSLARVEPLMKRYGYWAAATAVLLEGMGIPAPGQTLLIASGLEATRGRMNIALLLFLVTAAAILGNSVGYVIGRWGGRLVLDKFKVGSQRQQQLDDLFGRRGGLVILVGRFVEGLRQLNGILAGVMKMPWLTFTAYNIAGAVLWTCVWGLGAYYLGRDIRFVGAFFHQHHRWLFTLSVIALLAWFGYLVWLRIRAITNAAVER